MTVIFKGTKKETKSRGCGCRKRRGSRMTTIKTFHLPSGATVVFRIGARQKVSDSDGEFLLENFPEAFEKA